MVVGKKGMVINMIYVAVMGHGVVGSGVVEVLCKNAASIAHKAGAVSYTHLLSVCH